MRSFVFRALIIVLVVLGTLTIRSFFITSAIKQSVAVRQAGSAVPASTSRISQIKGITVHVETLQRIYDAQKGLKRSLSIHDKGLSFDIFKKAKYLYIDLQEDGTKFAVRDHGADVLVVDNTGLLHPRTSRAGV